jgi:tetratricopeptide (TPR) repeat protein
MTDEAKALHSMLASYAAAERGELREAIRLRDSILQLDVSADQKVSARIFKSYHLIHLDELTDAARETESALELDQKERTGEFEESEIREFVLGNLDCAWVERLKEFGRRGEWNAGILWGEERLGLLAHLPGTYMPLTQLWIGRKLAALGETERALVRLRAGLAAEIADVASYRRMMEDAASSARTALEIYHEFGALSPQQAFEAGTDAMKAGEHDSAIRAYEGVLALDVAAEVTTHTHVRLSLLYFKQQQKKKAAGHGEKAIRNAGTLQSGIFSELDIDLRDVFFAKLEGVWVQDAEQIKALDGISAARDYLLERLKLIHHLPDDYFPAVRLQIGKYSVEMGDAETARENLINAVASQFPDSEDVALRTMYQHIREEAAEWVPRAAQMRNTSRSPQRAESQSDVAGDSKCWIATAACGPESIEVLVLRRFRDRNCARGWKSVAVRTYYWTAPAVAQPMAKYPLLRRIVRSLVVIPAARYALWSLTTPFQRRK